MKTPTCIEIANHFDLWEEHVDPHGTQTEVVAVAIDRMRRETTMKTTQFYIVQKSNWQNDQWKPVAGSFPTRSEAEEEIENYKYQFVGQHGLDLKSERHAKVVSRTWLRANGYPTSHRGEDRLVEAIELENFDIDTHDAMTDAEIRLGM